MLNKDDEIILELRHHLELSMMVTSLSPRLNFAHLVPAVSLNSGTILPS